MASTAAAAATCPQGPSGGLHVTVDTPRVEVAYRADFDRKELANLAGMAAVHDDGILGLTMSRYALSATTRNEHRKTGDGRVCAWIVRVDAVLSIPAMTVYVAREYAPGSCQYRAVMAHEQEHVRITGSLVPAFAPELEAELKARLQAAMPVVADGFIAAETEVNRRLERIMAELIERLEARREGANALIDTEESYRRTADQCAGW